MVWFPVWPQLAQTKPNQTLATLENGIGGNDLNELLDDKDIECGKQDDNEDLD
jgi:hypothetical protein